MNQNKGNKDKIKDDKEIEVPINILYNNIEIIEFNDNFKMTNIYKTAFIIILKLLNLMIILR